MLRERGGDSSEMMHLVKKAKESLEELCEMVEEMDGDSMGMRGGYGQRGNDGMGIRGGDSMGQRRGYRIYQDDDFDDFGERRRRDSRGRYM